MDDLIRMQELRQQGFCCSQILLIMGLDLQGKSNPELIRSVRALCGGLGFTGELCGALTGAACLLGLYAGKGTPNEAQDPRLDFMVTDLVSWFKQEYGQQYGGIRCENIIAGNSGNMAVRCPVIVAETFRQVKELLIKNEIDLYGQED